MGAPLHPLRRVREAASLSVDDMGALVGLPASEVIAAEAGPRLVRPELLEQYAISLGLSVRGLLAGQEPSAVALLFRGIRARGAAMELPAEARAGLGDFVRCVRDLARLRGLAEQAFDGASERWLAAVAPAPLPPHGELHAQARRLAAELRTFLGLRPDEPITSMRALVASMGITTSFVEPEQLGADIEGAAVLDPHPAILVNLVGGGEKWWRTRMTLGHELCHLLHDRSALDPEGRRKFFLLSPFRPEHSRGPGWQVLEHFDLIEARANAFAGDLLAPTEGVRSLVGTDDPAAASTVFQVCRHFMVGPTTAINRLQNSFTLSREQRRQMESQIRLSASNEISRLLSGGHADALPPGARLRDAEFVGLVLRSHARGKIDAIETREYLQLRPSDPLPAHSELSDEQRQPLVTAGQRAYAVALRYLLDRTGSLLTLEMSHAADGGWVAQVYRPGSAGTRTLCGELHVRADLQIAEPVTWLAPSP